MKSTSALNYLCCTFIMVASLSCSNTKDNDSKSRSAKTFQFVAKPQKNEKKLAFNDLVEEYKYIKLETSPQCLLGEIEKLEFHDSKIYILSGGVFCFDTEGKFLFSINNRGKGPGEFLKIYSMSIDNGKIYLYDNSLWQLLCFDAKNSQFIESQKIPFSVPAIEVIENKLYIDRSMFPDKMLLKSYRGPERILVASIEKPADPLYRFLPEDRYNAVLNKQSYSYSGKYYFIDPFLLEVYRIKNDKIEGFFSIDWPGKKLSEEQITVLVNGKQTANNLSRESGKAHYLNSVFETPSFVLAYVMVDNDMSVVLFDKKSGGTRVFNHLGLERTDYQPDLDQGSVKAVYDEYFCTTTSYGLYSVTKKTQVSKNDPEYNNVELINSLDSQSNPVIALIKFKPLVR